VIATPSEQRALAALPPARRLHMAKQIFCAKEALYKAQYPVTGIRFGFQDVTLDLTAEQGLIWQNPPEALECKAPLVIPVKTVEGTVLAACGLS